MEQYISKSALVAEIERRRVSNAKERYFGRLIEDNYFLDFIDTLEVKEMNSNDILIEKVVSFLNEKNDRDTYTIGYIKRHLKEIIKEIGL